MSRRDSLLAWFPVALRYGGLLGVIFVAVVWLLTNRLEPSLLALFGSMVGIGEGVDAIRELASTRPTPQDLNLESPRRRSERQE